MTDLVTLRWRQRWYAQLLTCRLDTTLRKEYERRLAHVQTEIATRQEIDSCQEIAHQTYASLGQTARQSTRNDRARGSPAHLVRGGMVGGDARMKLISVYAAAHDSDKALIDRGFWYVAHTELVTAAVTALQTPDAHNQTTLQWARQVLSTLPENKKEEAMP